MARIDTHASAPILVWLNSCLRLDDNPALFKACQTGAPVIMLYIHVNQGPFAPIGSAAKVWLYHALSDINQALDSGLVVLEGSPEQVLDAFIVQTGAQALYFNHSFIKDRLQIEKKLASNLRAKGIDVVPYNGSFLTRPEKLLKDDGGFYKVFTPFYKRFLATQSPLKPYSIPANLSKLIVKPDGARTDLHKLDLLPDLPWSRKITKHWTISEQGAHIRLDHFIANHIETYKHKRNYPGIKGSSDMSPYLSFGQISPNRIWYKLINHGPEEVVEPFLRQLIWREFYGHLHYHAPHFLTQNVQIKFDDFGFQTHSEYLRAWQTGQTGIPIIDAGMRQLWATGTMHNRIRMLVASFLTKNMNVDWRLGAEWFEDCLFDANLANNRGGWQWVAGTGTDAAPYFRIFNPVTQAQKFDAEGDYVRQWVPELAKMDAKHIHTPHLAPTSQLQKAGVVPGDTYPKPILDLAQTRQQALDRLARLKKHCC